VTNDIDSAEFDGFDEETEPAVAFEAPPPRVAVTPRRPRHGAQPEPLRDLIAERAVLGRAFWRPADEFADVVAQVAPEMFWRPAHRSLFGLMVDRHQDGKPIDLLAIANHLRQFDPRLLDDLGGLSGLTGLSDEYFKGIDWPAYARAIRDCWRLRRIEAVGREIVDLAYSGESADEAEADAIARLGRIEIPRRDRSVPDALRARLDLDHAPARVKTGITRFDIDVLHGGLRPGYYVLAGRTSEGKSALMISMLVEMVLYQRKSALVVSVEMSEDTIGLRFAAIAHGQHAARLINGDAAQYSTEERRAVEATAQALSDRNFRVVPRPMKPSEIRAMAGQMQREAGLDIVFVDYLQRLHPDRPMNNRVVEVGMISGAMKTMSEELQVPVVALAQLSRAAVGREKPALHHLRESGDIEQDADQVWLLSRTDEEATFDVAKNRHGKIAEIPMRFIKAEMRFTESSTTY